MFLKVKSLSMSLGWRRSRWLAIQRTPTRLLFGLAKGRYAKGGNREPRSRRELWHSQPRRHPGAQARGQGRPQPATLSQAKLENAPPVEMCESGSIPRWERRG